MSRLSLRPFILATLIGSLAPLPLAMLELEQAAYAKGNGGGNGGAHGGGNGGGHGNGGSHGNGNAGGGNGAGAQASNADATTAPTDVKAHKPTKTELADDPSLSPDALGKLNGVLHASPQAIANASPNSPLGMARELAEALGGFLDPEAAPGEDPEADPITVADLGALMAGMTNKPVTAAQVEAVVDRLAEDDPENPALHDLDPALAQEIADEANKIKGYDTAASDDDGTGQTDDVIN